MIKIFFWFGVFVMSLLVMVQPARASGTVSSATVYAYNAPTPCYGQSSVAVMLACMNTANFGGVNTWYDVVYTSGDAFNIRFCYNNCSEFQVGTSGGRSVVSSGCPANSTGTTTCTCTDPYIPNAGATACVMPACPALGADAGAYWITTGTIPASIYTAGNGTFCKTGCETKSFLTIPRPDGYPIDDGATKISNGVRTYYSFREYMYTGASCTGGDTLPVASTVPVADGCAANQSMIQMGSKIRCIDPSTGAQVESNSASAVAAAKTLADAKMAAQIQAAGDAVAAAGGSASDVAAAQSVAAGAAAVQAGAPTSNGFAPDDPMNAFCVDNPQATICKAQTVGATAVSTAALSGLYTDGALTAGKTVSSVVGGFKTRVLASGIGSAAGGFFTVNQAAGACPVWSADVPMMGVITFDFYCQSTFQNLLPWIRSVLLLIFSVIAFRIAIL